MIVSNDLITTEVQSKGVFLGYSRHSREVLFFDIHVDRSAKHATFPSMVVIADLLEEAADDDDFPVKEFENGEITYVLKKAVRDQSDETLTLLLESSDKNAPDTRYINHATRTKRDFAKNSGEGGGHSAHVVISLRSQSSASNVYLAIIEDVPNFQPQRIKSVLNTAIRLLCKEQVRFTYKKPGGSQKDVAFVPRLDFFGHVSAKFMQDIENAKIHGLTLINPNSGKALGQGKYFVGTETYMKVKMVNAPKPGNVFASIRNAVASAKADYTQARISFQPETGGKSTHVDIDTSNGNVVGKEYVKSKHFGGLTPPIATSAVDDIVLHLEAKMKFELKKERS